ncbi:MAG: right-handed parallel beta-helix repeat-containing protein [Rhodobacteraceae bacterium]|nr:right-handed parallel beta-helix repeat-containing protein [Paracoccaceae bacterium]
MNKAITEGLVLMPPPFAAGLSLWSRGDGIPGSGSYAGQPNAAFVPNDADFTGCLELQKADSVQKLRCFQQIPFQPGLFLRVTARIKAVAGPLAAVRIAGFAARSNGTAVPGITTTGPATQLTTYGQVVEISAIIASGARTGVTLNWGREPVYAHLGLDLTGTNGGIVRIDDITVEDVTSVFLREMMDWVDVRDYGAVGDGIADDTAAFEAADTAAAGRTLVVSKGTFRLGGDLTIDSPVRFEGRVTQAAAQRLVLRRNFDLDSYTSAFGTETEAFRKALQALFFNADHVALDLRGRRVDLTGPVDVAAIAGVTTFEIRRLITNGMLSAAASPAWTPATATSLATYNRAAPTTLSAVANIANIAVGAHVTGNGVGREVYVRSVNVAAQTLELSQPIWGFQGSQTFTFTRYRYMLDFSGFTKFSKFELTGMELQCNSIASGILLAPSGDTFRMAISSLTKPSDRGITSHGRGCQDLIIDNCSFVSAEETLLAQNRRTIVFNVNANDAKIRGNRAARFAHFGIVGGSTHIFLGNHFFGGDDATLGVRRAGLVFTNPTPHAIITGNYIDNSHIEMSNEHDANPEFDNEFSFGGMTVTGNVFVSISVSSAFRWLVLAPKGPGHFLTNMSVTGNTFRTFSGVIDRVDMADTTVAALDYSRFRNIVFNNNTFHGVTQTTQSPVVFEHVQNTESATWVVSAGAFLPFAARARTVEAVATKGAVTTAGNVTIYDNPNTLSEQGASLNQVHLRWSQAVKGRALVTLRCDNPN